MFKLFLLGACRTKEFGHLVFWHRPLKKTVVRRAEQCFGFRRVNSGLT
jgi:hypothetical protein